MMKNYIFISIGCDGLIYQKLNDTYQCRLFNCSDLSKCSQSANNLSTLIILDPGDLSYANDSFSDTDCPLSQIIFDSNCSPFSTITLLSLVIIFFLLDFTLIVAVVYFRKRDALVFYAITKRPGKYRKLSSNNAQS